jgi:hypothetical protein
MVFAKGLSRGRHPLTINARRLNVECRFFISTRTSFEYFARGRKGTTMECVRKRVKRIPDKKPHGLRCRTSRRDGSMVLLIEEILEHLLLPYPLIIA